MTDEAPGPSLVPEAGFQARPEDLDALVARLAETVANLDAYILQCAERLAEPRIASVEADASARLADTRDGYERRVVAAADLERELRLQLDAQLRQVAELRWLARYLPPALRRLALGSDPPTPISWDGDRPGDAFIAAVDKAARTAGASAFPDTLAPSVRDAAPLPEGQPHRAGSDVAVEAGRG